MHPQAIGEQPSARVVNAIEASLSKYIQVGAILFKGIQAPLHRQSNNIHGGSVKSIKNNNEVSSVHAVPAVCTEKLEPTVAPSHPIFVCTFSSNDNWKDFFFSKGT